MLKEIPEKFGSVFEKKITLGNIIQLGVLLVALVLAYSKLQGSQDLLKTQFDVQQQVVEQLRSQLTQQYVRADVHNEQLKAINGKLADIQDDVKDIKRSLKR